MARFSKATQRETVNRFDPTWQECLTVAWLVFAFAVLWAVL